ncbi:MAG TPA: sulfatase, partial [bacterium]|nr:sulfatase [bacterium]
RAMAWRSVAWEKDDGPADETAGGNGGQSAPSVWWRFVNVTAPASLTARGRAAAAGTQAAVLIDTGTGVWKERVVAGADAGGELRLEARVTGNPGEVVRLGLAVTDGAVVWDSVRSVTAAPAERRPIVLLTLDTTRRDALGCYAAGVETPHLDRLAREGTVWDAAFSPTPSTGPAHATAFLSRDPVEHGFLTNGRSLPRAGGRHLVAQVGAVGYESAAFVSLGTVAADLGFAQAFDTFDDTLDQGWWRFAASVNERALPWIAAHPQGEGRPPGFLWIHYSDPHRPYGTADDPGQGIGIVVNGRTIAERAPTLGLEQSWEIELRPGNNEVVLLSPHDYDDDREHWYILRDRAVAADGASVALGEGWRTVRSFPRMRKRGTLRVTWNEHEPVLTTLTLRVEDNPEAAEARRRYDREVTAMDAAVGDLLDALERAGWLEDGVILAFADHGEDLGENGHFGHIHHVGATLTHVPMLMWGRGVPAQRVTGLVGLIDVAPTIAARMGIPPSPHWRGIDALSPPPRRRLYLEAFPPEADAHVRGVVELPYWVAGPVDGGEDAVAVTDLRTGEPAPNARVDALREAWREWIPEGVRIEDAGPETRERLRALGYLQ